MGGGGEGRWHTVSYISLLNKHSLLSHLAQVVYPQRHPTMSSCTTAIIDNPIVLQSGAGVGQVVGQVCMHVR